MMDPKASPTPGPIRRMTEPQRHLAADPAHIAMAVRIAKHHARSHPELYEEYVSAAMYGLCLAALGTDGRNFRCYACDHIYNQMNIAYRSERFRGCRKSARAPARHAIDDVGDLAARPDATPQFEEWLECLPPVQAEVCRDIYLHAMTQHEVARRLGVRDQTVFHWHDEALDRLSGRWAARADAGRAWRRGREALGLTRAQLADRIGKSYSYVTKVEYGQLEPTAGMRAVLATALGDAPDIRGG